MPAVSTTTLTTAEELLAMPDDGRRYELIEGVLHEVSPAGLEASKIALRFGGLLDAFVTQHGLGWVVGANAGFYFGHDPDTVRMPDVAFVRTERLPPVSERPRLSSVLPDLAVEVVSPTDRPGAVADKVAFYQRNGVPLVWVIYPASRRVVAHRPGQEPRTFGEGDVLDGGDIVPGCRMPVADILR